MREARAGAIVTQRLPDFFVIGAGRSGTTSLQVHLDAHPQVFMCRKSPDYFVSGDAAPPWETEVARAMMDHRVHDRDEYLALFRDAAGKAAVGEVSPVYLQSLAAPGRIHALCPDVRIVAILRHPVDRAYAHFLGRQRDGIEPAGSFAARIERELKSPLPDDIAFGSYLGCGRYHHFLRGYYSRFPRDRIRVYLFDDFVESPGRVMADLFAFLGVDPEVEVDVSQRRNRGGVIANPLLRAIWTGTVGLRTRLRARLPESIRNAAGPWFLHSLEVPPLDPALRARMLTALHDDIVTLQSLIDRDLGTWLSREP